MIILKKIISQLTIFQYFLNIYYHNKCLQYYFPASVNIHHSDIFRFVRQDKIDTLIVQKNKSHSSSRRSFSRIVPTISTKRRLRIIS